MDKVDEVFKKYKGKYLCVDDKPKIIEGKLDSARLVLIEFESENDFNDWYYSNDYQTILKHRLRGAVCNSITVKGSDTFTH